ncbi:antitermination protein N [Escherichia coli]|uniref:antitermination protein N n=1 Tax=Escherichia coli TaxID=562 RepID=UPI003AF4F2D7
MDAQTRRRERRAEKQAQWKAANPLLVGVSAKPVNRPILSLNRKPKSRVESALNPIDLTVLAEYHEQIESNLQRIERKNQRTWYKDANPFGNKIHAVQKSRGKSTPLI